MNKNFDEGSLNNLNSPFENMSPDQINILVEESEKILDSFLNGQINDLFDDTDSSQFPISTFKKPNSNSVRLSLLVILFNLKSINRIESHLRFQKLWRSTENSQNQL